MTFLQWFNKNKQDDTNALHVIVGVTCLLAKHESGVWFSNNPECIDS